jgi:hypothetical protein
LGDLDKPYHVCFVCTRGRNIYFCPFTTTVPPSSIFSKMLYLIGLGLSDEKDITVRGLEVVRKASRVYLEAYTSILLVDKEILVRRFLAIYILRELTLMYSRRNTMAGP